MRDEWYFGTFWRQKISLKNDRLKYKETELASW